MLLKSMPLFTVKKIVAWVIPSFLLTVALIYARHWVDRFRYEGIDDLPDRKVMKDSILPAFAALGGKLLWVGARHYTKDYPALLEAEEAECFTIDIDPSVARYGHPLRHRTANLLDVGGLFPPETFNAVLCNGIFGFGVDDIESQAKALEAMERILKPEGWLLLGWNTDRSQDPFDSGLASKAFVRTPFPGLWQRLDVKGTSHVYDILRKRP